MSKWAPAAQGTVAVRETAIAICEKWLGTFAGREIKHIPAHEYAEDAVRDLIDQISAIDVASPSPEALPASGVEAREALFRDLLAFAADRAALDPTFAKGFEKQVIADARALVARAAALTSAPAPEDRT